MDGYHETTFEYDSMGRRTKRTLPLGMSETMVYDDVGNLESKTDFNGNTTTYTYDAVNRLTSKIPDPSLSEPTVSFTYTATGQRESMTDASGVTTYTYDDRDRMLTKAAPAGTLTYTYDDAGNVTSILSSNAGGTDVEYTWDANNRLQDVIDAHAGTFTYGYDDVGNQTSLSYPNGIVGTWTYQENNWLAEIVYTGTSGIVASYSYTTAPTGHRTGVVEHTGRTVEYGYDELYRLTSEQVTNDPNSISGLVGYTYDDVGNRLTRTSTLAGVANQTFTYDDNDRMSGVTWDDNGNALSGVGGPLSYGFDDRLKTAAGATLEFDYDGSGERVSRTVAGVTTMLLTDDVNPSGWSHVMEEITGGVVVRANTFGNGLLAESAAGLPQACLSDGQSSVRLTVDETSLSSKADLDAFGNVLSSSGPFAGRYGYVGERFEAGLDIVHLRARDLSPAYGRFLTQDPLLGDVHDPRTLARYTYAAQTPSI